MLKARFTGRVLPKVVRASTGPLDRVVGVGLVELHRAHAARVLVAHQG